MAKVVEQFPENLGKRGGRSTSYPYDDWFDGQKWVLSRGEDFTSKTTSMVSGIKNQLQQRGLKAIVGSSGDEVYVQVTGPMSDEELAEVKAKREVEAQKRQAKVAAGKTESPAPAKATAKKTAAKK